jgi:hypothetical protein
MHRTVWFSFCCLVAGFGALVSIKAIATPSLFAVVANFPDALRTRPGPDESLTPNRAAKSDRLPIPDMRAPTNTFTPQVATATTPVVPVETAAAPANIPAEPARTNPDDARQMAAWTVAHRRWRKANAKLIAAPPQQRLVQRPRPTAEADNGTGKVIVNTLPCRQDAVGGLLRALDLSPRCGS